MLIHIPLARRQIIEKHIIRHVAPRRLSGGGVKREMNAGENAAAGGFIGHCRKTPVGANHIWISAEIYLELNIVAFVEARENGRGGSARRRSV